LRAWATAGSRRWLAASPTPSASSQGLCAAASALCAVLLVNAYRRYRTRLLLWSGLCFCGLGSNNALLFIDLVMVPSVDLAVYRNVIGAAALLLLLIGLIWDGDNTKGSP
jgi:hypothetical protein